MKRHTLVWKLLLYSIYFLYGCLLIVTANGYVLFAANLEDFKNLAKRFVPDNLAGKLTEMVSEYSLQHKKQKGKIDDEPSDAVRMPQRDKNIEKYGFKKPERLGEDRKPQNINDFPSTRFKIINKHDDKSDERFDTTKFYSNKPVDNNDRSKEQKDRESEVEKEHDNFQFPATKSSKDRRYKTVQRTTPTEESLEQSPAYISARDNQSPSIDDITPKNLFYVDIRKEGLLSSTVDDIETTDHDRKITYEDNVSDEKAPTPDISITDREVHEIYSKPTIKKSPVDFDNENPKIAMEKESQINGRNIQQRKLKKQSKSNDNMMFDKIILNKNKGSYEELPEKDEVYFSEEAVKPISKNTKQPKLVTNIARENVNKDNIFESEEATSRINFSNKPQILRELNKQNIFESEETTSRINYSNKPKMPREPNKQNIFESEETTSSINYSNKPQIPREPNKQNIFESEETTSRISNDRKPEILEEPTTTEKDLEQETYKPEPVKARTENLLFNSKEENATINPNIMKGTGIPTRERYKMSSPNYYKNLPRIVEKYDFKEPIPEKDREHEKINDRFAQDPARINKNRYKQTMQRKVSRQFKAILDELSKIH